MKARRLGKGREFFWATLRARWGRGAEIYREETIRDIALEANFRSRRRGAFIVEIALRPNPADSERLAFDLSLNSVQLTDWIDSNPVEFGPNWASMMDVAIRAANWVAALTLGVGGAERN